MLNPSFLYIPDLSADMKGLLLLLKTFCVKGTNYLTYRT